MMNTALMPNLSLGTGYPVYKGDTHKPYASTLLVRYHLMCVSHMTGNTGVSHI